MSTPGKWSGPYVPPALPTPGKPGRAKLRPRSATPTPSSRVPASSQASKTRALTPMPKQPQSRLPVPSPTAIANRDAILVDQASVTPMKGTPRTPRTPIVVTPLAKLLAKLPDTSWEAKKQLRKFLTQGGKPIWEEEKLEELIDNYSRTNRAFKKMQNAKDPLERKDFSVNTWYLQAQMRDKFNNSPSPYALKSQGPAEDYSLNPLPRTPDKQSTMQLLPSYNGSSYIFTPVVLLPQGDEFRQELPADYGPVRHSKTRNVGTSVPLTASVYKRFSRQRPGNSLGMVLAARKNFLRHVHEASTMT